ncbi:MAG: hypothetical protein HY016_02795 [Nitrosomonadales bacterium]|nr:hypothetical protein [Nitrosomonadales bacterium]
MMDVNQTPPDRMTSELRRQEVATLLARGIARMRELKSRQPETTKTESEFELAIPPGRSVHGVSNNQRNMETK